MVAFSSSSEVVGTNVISDTADSEAVPVACKLNLLSTLNLQQPIECSMPFAA